MEQPRERERMKDMCITQKTTRRGVAPVGGNPSGGHSLDTEWQTGCNYIQRRDLYLGEALSGLEISWTFHFCREEKWIKRWERQKQAWELKNCQEQLESSIASEPNGSF